MVILSKITYSYLLFSIHLPGIKDNIAMTLATSFHKYKAMSDPEMARNDQKCPKLTWYKRYCCNDLSYFIP